jgi:repressor LexA
MKPITKKQKQVFDFINKYISQNGLPPTIEEICRELKLKAVSTVHEHIKTLTQKGYLSKADNSARTRNRNGMRLRRILL